MKKFLLALIAIVVLTGAKATVGHDFKVENIPRLEIGKTTLPEAIALLGSPPQMSTVGASGAVGHTWQHIEVKSSLWTGRSGSTSKSVVLVFNHDGTFQRIFQLSGIVLDPESNRRLMTDPAAALAQE